MEQTALLAARLHRAGLGGGKDTRGEEPKGLGGLSLLRGAALPHSLLFTSSGGHALTPRGWIFLLFSK